MATSAHFGDRLAAAVDARESQIVLGLDPDLRRLWPQAKPDERLADALADAIAAARTALRATPAGATADTAPASERSELAGLAAVAPARTTAAARAAAATLAHCRALIDAAGPACAAVKPQLACFERLGPAGWLILDAVSAYARDVGLLVLADGKRGDVPVSATAYAQALLAGADSPFGRVEGLRADALTVNPLLGRDALEPLVAGARHSGAGVFVLVRTSNPGASDLMDLRAASGQPLWARVAEIVDALGVTGESGLADIGAVTGATAPEHLARMRELMPRAPFLLPGVGAQGGDVAALGPAFAPGRAGGLVTASRSIAAAYEQHGGAPPQAARQEAERLREIAWTLA